MAILFAVIARGTTVLAQHAGCAGNFLEVTEQVLTKITPENAKLTYSHGKYLFHYITEDRIIYMCIADEDLERSVAFTFLNDIKRRFETQYGARAHTALPYAMSSEFNRVLMAQMKHSNLQMSSVPAHCSTDNVTRVQDQVEELRGIMVKNIDNIANRGEKLELLVDKTDELSANSVTFKKSSRSLQRSLCMKNVKITIILVIVCILVIYFIISAACGGLAWQRCVKK